MTGLEKIVAAIRQEAQAEADAVLEEAKAEAARIQADEQDASCARCDAIRTSAERQAAELLRAGVSAAELLRRRRLLETKQEILASSIELALEEVYALPEDEYFNLLVRMAAAYAEPRQGELLLGKRDLARCPSDFERRLNQALTNGAALSASRETRLIDGGFILKYGEIELNCSFRAIFDARREELSDRIRAILFA